MPQRHSTLTQQERQHKAGRARRPATCAQGSGEPRFFAFFWGVFLLVAAAMTVFSGRDLGVQEPSTARPGVLALIEVALAGVCALWPMVRLSQAGPASPVGAALADLLVLVVPAQGVLWPMVWLAKWPWTIGAGLATLIVSWGALVGSVVAAGSARDDPGARTAWMLLVLAATAGAPAALALAIWVGRPLPEAAALASPYTAAVALVSAPSGLTPRMSQQEWLAVLAPGAASAPLWVWAGMRVRRRRA